MVAAVLNGLLAPQRVRAQASSSFAAEIAALSESGGYFDTDNLISNERSYLHVIPELAAQNVTGGAYIGVGPDQNFSYIAHIRPNVAFIVDIRRDNLLLQLLFKALFEMAHTRVDYLTLLFGRPTPEPLAGWETKPLDAIVSYLDRAQSLATDAVTALRSRVTKQIVTFGVPLSAADLATIDRFHRQFIDAGIALRFQSTGRAPQSSYPTYRDLLLETDRTGVRQNYLMSEADFQFLKMMETHDQVIPVVGDVSGPSALIAIGASLTARHERLSAFYTSNVEFYLFREGTFDRFVRNLNKIPHADNAVVIRSFFSGYGQPMPGYGSASATQPVQTLLDGYARGQFHTYAELAAWQRHSH